MTTGRIIKGYGLFIIGLFIASMGVAFSTKAGLGTSPVASVPYSISLVSSLLSFGGWLNLLSVVQILYIVISALICLVFLGRLQGVREGSIIAAVLVGSIIKVYNRIFDKVRSGK